MTRNTFLDCLLRYDQIGYDSDLRGSLRNGTHCLACNLCLIQCFLKLWYGGLLESQSPGVLFQMHMAGLYPRLYIRDLLSGGGVGAYILGPLLVQSLIELKKLRLGKKSVGDETPGR